MGEIKEEGSLFHHISYDLQKPHIQGKESKEKE